MEYRAIITFVDSANDDKLYHRGETFKGTKKRIEELSTKNNKAGIPVIKGTAKPKKTKATKGSK